MRILIHQVVETLRGSYWFVPTLMSLGAMSCFALTSWLDHVVDPSWLESVAWLGTSQPAGARSLLSTIAASMIGVAGVTFSVTIVSVSFAASNFGPRLLTNFLRDRGNQVTLGTFIATFVYCLLALRLVQDPDPTLSPTDAVWFVPQVTVLGAVLFAFASLSVLIYFLHHVPESIRVSTVVANVGTSLEGKVVDAFLSAPDETNTKIMPDRPKSGGAIKANRNGFVQHVELTSLTEMAQGNDCRIWLDVRAGDFVYRNQQMGLAAPSTSTGELDCEQLRAAFAIGNHRTQTQDFLFLVDELVEIATRALSPGVNDPITAMACLDWLGSSLCTVATVYPPSGVRIDSDGVARVSYSAIRFEEIVERVFEQLRPYLATDRNAALYAFDVLTRTAAATKNSNELHGLRKAGVRLARSYSALHPLPQDRAELAKSLWKMRSAILGRSPVREGGWRGVPAE